jgi:hypothetical protein
MKKIFSAVAVLILCSVVAHAAPRPRPQIEHSVNGPTLAIAAAVPAGGGHQTNLSWTPSSDGAANPTLAYDIYRGTTAGGESATPINASPVAAGCTSSTTCVYTDTSVSAGATYYYTAKATLNGGFSPASNEVSVQIPIAGVTLTGTAQ